MPKTLGRPPSIGPPKLATPKPITVCSRCRQVVGKGIPHSKNCTISDRRVNLHNLSLEDPRGRELEAGQVYKEKLSFESCYIKESLPFKL